MIIYEGDFVALNSSQENWFEVIEILGPMQVQLDNGQTVEASEKHIKGHLSASEFESNQKGEMNY